MMAIPYWLKSYLDVQKIEDIQKAVAKAELQTAGEIVPVIVRSSSTVGHVPLILFLGVMALGWIIVLSGIVFWQGMLVVFLAAVLTAILGSRCNYLQRVLVPLPDRQRQVFERAQLEFYQSNITQTRDGTGILLFISLLERQVVVLADDAIDRKIQGSDVWCGVMNDILSGIKDRDMVRGLTKGIHKCGEILGEYFPIKPDDVNELPNKLVIKD